MDQKIREAMEQGDFKNLANHGKPLNLRKNPYEPPELRVANMMLEANGFAPAWMEERREIDTAAEQAAAALARSWELCSRAEKPEWEQAVKLFREVAAQLNARILTYNLTVPAASFQRPQVDPDHEIRRCQQAGT